MNFGIKKINKKLIYNEIIEFKVLNGKKSRPANQTATRVLLLKSRFFSLQGVIQCGARAGI